MLDVDDSPHHSSVVGVSVNVSEHCMTAGALLIDIAKLLEGPKAF